MENYDYVRQCEDFSYLCCVDSITKTFPDYKQIFTQCQLIPETLNKSKCFNIKSYELAVKSQQPENDAHRTCCCEQLKNDANRKCCPEYNTTSSCIRLPHDPSHGFQLIEYADKSCSQLKLTEKDCCCHQQNCLSKAVVTDPSECYDKGINCDILNVPCVRKVVCVAPPRPYPCLKNKHSNLQECNRACVKESSSKEIVLCQKCKEKRMNRKHQERSGESVVRYQQKCNCVKDQDRNRCIKLSKLECEPQKCKYLDLIHKIKCIFIKEH